MINRQQHIMIFGLYTLFSVFLGVVSITLSDSFYVGIGGFFAFFLTFICVHIFLLGQNVTTKIMNVLYNMDDNKNAYQQDLKNIRDVVNNVTDIMTNLVNDNNDLQQEIQNHYRKYDTQLSDFKTKIEKLETETTKNMHYQTHQPENPAFEKHYATPQHHAQSEMNVRTIHEKPEKNKHTVPVSREPQKTLSPNILDEDFFNSYTDDSFSDLTFPKVIERSLSTINLHDVDDDDEFAIVDQKIADTYQHLLEDVPEVNPEAFLEEKKQYQPNKPDIALKKQSDGIPPLSIKAPHTPNIAINASDFSDEFIDVTADLIHNEIDSNKKTDNNKENDSKFDIKKEPEEEFVNSTTAFIQEEFVNNTKKMEKLPSLVTLIPEEQLKHIAHRQTILSKTARIPSLNSLLKEPTQLPSDDNNVDAIANKINDDTPLSDSPKHNQSTEQNFITIIRKALENNDVDLFIRPVTDNRVREVKFFEAYNYLRDDKGNVIEASEFAEIARQEGMGIALDRLMLVRSIQVLRYIKQSIGDAAIFCNISLLSLMDTHFEIELKDLLQEKSGIAENLIFEFPQAQLHHLNSVRIEKMMQFHAMGIRFSVDTIIDALPDLSELVNIGVSFIKIRPPDFTHGIHVNGHLYKGVNIKQACQSAGLLLCVSAIDEHNDLLVAVENKADLLQGDLLGEKERSDRLEMYVA